MHFRQICVFINAIGTVSQRCQPGPRGVSGVTKRQPPPLEGECWGGGQHGFCRHRWKKQDLGWVTAGPPQHSSALLRGVCHREAVSRGPAGRSSSARLPPREGAAPRVREHAASGPQPGRLRRAVSLPRPCCPHTAHTHVHVCAHIHTQAQVHNDMLALTCEPTHTHAPCRRKFLVVGNGSAGLSVRRQHGAGPAVASDVPLQLL